MSKDAWSINHSKAYICLSLCIADGKMNVQERNKLAECAREWDSDMSKEKYVELIEQSAQRLSKAGSGVKLLDGVQRSAKQIHKELEGNKKLLFRFLKQLKTIAEADEEFYPATENEVRVLRYVSHGLGFKGKLSVQLKDAKIDFVRL
ncbi:MAG: TerB family tellurite resistance protein [Myxococcota bacterium]|nr:TerB family tellurite resistance protein [Myxococcota bacterium]